MFLCDMREQTALVLAETQKRVCVTHNNKLVLACQARMLKLLFVLINVYM